MEENDEKSYGFVTVGVPPESKEIKVSEYIKAKFKDDRLISVAKLEDDTYFISVQNPENSGRANEAAIRLTKESFLGLIATSHLYFQCKNEDIGMLVKEYAETSQVTYRLSDNLTPLKST